ncbi:MULTISPECIES: hypothetical protein [Bacteria]|uniref:hypothetical protein n=1 Tax=Bacteria TaxID=2 RepID=UPI003C7D4A53
MTYTEEQWNAACAAEIVQLARDVNTGQPMEILILDTFDAPAQELDKHLARAIAVRLVELAEQLPEPPRILRRSSDIDEAFRDREGGV